MSDYNHVSDLDKNAAIVSASERGHQQCIESLIRRGADVNTTNAWGDTPVKCAVDKGHVECVNLLIKAGADVNKLNNVGGSAMIGAAQNGNEECVISLVEAGADVNISSNGTKLILLVFLESV